MSLACLVCKALLSLLLKKNQFVADTKKILACIGYLFFRVGEVPSCVCMNQPQSPVFQIRKLHGFLYVQSHILKEIYYLSENQNIRVDTMLSSYFIPK